jgi:hypothetical protein
MQVATYYAIKILITGSAPSPLYIQQEHDELFLSVHGRLSDQGKSAHLDSSQLAVDFRDAYLPRLQKRYGHDVSIEIIESTARGGNIERTLQRIEADSVMARKRIETGILASNKRPEQ